MKAVAPEERIGREKIADLMAPEVENERSPILVRAFARVFMFVEGRAIKAGQRPFIAWKMSGNPIDKHADAGIVQCVDEVLKIVGRAVAARGGIKTGDLVAP